MKLKDLHIADRPREKLEKYGPAKLTNSELLAILLRSGVKGVNVVGLSSKILKQFSARGLSEATLQEFAKTFGLGPAKACEIVACFELGRRLLKDKKSELVLGPQKVWEMLADIRDNKKEHFVMLFLDSRSQEIARHIISVGTLNASMVHPREVFERAIAAHTAQIIVAHNHPTGDTEPSREDMAITRRLVEAGKILDIEVIDHVIVTKKSFLSFQQRDLL